MKDTFVAAITFLSVICTAAVLGLLLYWSFEAAHDSHLRRMAKVEACTSNLSGTDLAFCLHLS